MTYCSSVPSRSDCDGWPSTLDGGTGTATYDSWDQRLDLLYYVVTLPTGESFMACIGSQDDMGDDAVRDAVASVAATGKTNTEYRR